MYGEQGEVMGPGKGKWEGKLLIKFPNNTTKRFEEGEVLRLPLSDRAPQPLRHALRSERTHVARGKLGST